MQEVEKVGEKLENLDEKSGACQENLYENCKFQKQFEMSINFKTFLILGVLIQGEK